MLHGPPAPQPHLPTADGQRAPQWKTSAAAITERRGGYEAEPGEENRTSSAYILLQLRDVGRSSSSGDGSVDGTGGGEPVTASVGEGVSGGHAPTPAVGICSVVGTGHGKGNAMLGRKAEFHAADAQQHVYQGQYTPRTGPTDGGRGSHCNMNLMNGGAPAGFSQHQEQQGDGGMAFAAAAAAAAIERGMYVTGLLPGFQGITPSPSSSPSSRSASAGNSNPPARTPHIPPAYQQKQHPRARKQHMQQRPQHQPRRDIFQHNNNQAIAQMSPQPQQHQQPTQPRRSPPHSGSSSGVNTLPPSRGSAPPAAAVHVIRHAGGRVAAPAARSAGADATTASVAGVGFRPIFPKGTPEGGMLVSPTTGQMVPVRRGVTLCFLCP